jgi:hypothetical protein
MNALNPWKPSCDPEVGTGSGNRVSLCLPKPSCDPEVGTGSGNRVSLCLPKPSCDPEVGTGSGNRVSLCLPKPSCDPEVGTGSENRVSLCLPKPSCDPEVGTGSGNRVSLCLPKPMEAHCEGYPPDLPHSEYLVTPIAFLTQISEHSIPVVGDVMPLTHPLLVEFVVSLSVGVDRTGLIPCQAPDQGTEIPAFSFSNRSLVTWMA